MFFCPHSCPSVLVSVPLFSLSLLQATPFPENTAKGVACETTCLPTLQLARSLHYVQQFSCLFKTTCLPSQVIPCHTRYICNLKCSCIVIVTRTLLLGLHIIPSATTGGQKQGQRDHERGSGTKGQGQRDRNRGTYVLVLFFYAKIIFIACWFL